MPHRPVGPLILVSYCQKSILQRMGEETHRAVAYIMPSTGRWITDPMVVGHGFFVRRRHICQQHAYRLMNINYLRYHQFIVGVCVGMSGRFLYVFSNCLQLCAYVTLSSEIIYKWMTCVNVYL